MAQFLIENYDTVTKFSIATSGQRKIFLWGHTGSQLKGRDTQDSRIFVTPVLHAANRQIYSAAKFGIMTKQSLTVISSGWPYPTYVDGAHITLIFEHPPISTRKLFDL